MASPHAAEDKHKIDPSEPLKGVIVCCTSVPPEQRTDVAHKVAELGGVHKYDLTPDVTHLVVGDYDTPKYRHVARERPDIKAMDVGWIDAVNDVWRNDDDGIDFLALETDFRLRPLETCGAEPSSRGGSQGQASSPPAARGSLLVCLTGFGDQRDEIAEKIVRNGGRYTGDLTRRCTHLIVSKPEGKKFTAAKSWGVHTVTLAWLDQSAERGMILEEARFDPSLPPEEQGVGAWLKEDPRRSTLGKRSRSAVLDGGGPDEGTRKLRKTASMKLSSQRNNLWGDILGRSGSREYSFAHENQPAAPAAEGAPAQPGLSLSLAQDDEGVFANCIFVVYGFPQQRKSLLEQTLATLGGCIATSLRAPAICSEPAGPRAYRFLIVPQTSQPDTHPQVPRDDIHVITEFYIENCLHNKRFFGPDEQVLGRPFPLFPIPGFSDLTICSAAFTGIELNQVARSVAQLGGRFHEQFRRTTSVLVCKSLQSIRKDKLKCALGWGVPVVSGDWLWECISTGYLAPVEDFVYPELKGRYPPKRPDKRDPFVAEDEEPVSRPLLQANPEPDKAAGRPNPDASRPPASAGVDTTAFDHDSPETSSDKKTGGSLLAAGDSVTSADFTTARCRPGESMLGRAFDAAAPLSELPSAVLNKPPQILRPARPAATGPARTISAPTKGWETESRGSAPVRARAPSAPPPEPSQPPPPPLPAAARQADEARARATQRAKAAAEMRQGLSSALSGLMPQPAAAAAADHAGHDAATSAAAAAAADPPRPRRRRHKILGRAISNASNASSAASLDGARPASESLRAGDDDGDEEPPSPPPATQLEYCDPEAMESKAVLMSRMAGGGDGASPPREPAAAAAAAAASRAAAAMRAFSGARSLRRR